jgi:transposase
MLGNHWKRGTFINKSANNRSMIERSGEFPEDVGELKALTRATVARANRFEAESEAARGEVLKLKAEVNDLAEAHATAKTEIARLTSILKTLRRGRFGKRSEKLSPDEDEQQSFVFEELETGLEAIERRLVAKTGAKPRNTSPAKPRFPSHLERVEEVLNLRFRRASRAGSGSRSARTRASGSMSCGRVSGSS